MAAVAQQSPMGDHRERRAANWDGRSPQRLLGQQSKVREIMGLEPAEPTARAISTQTPEQGARSLIEARKLIERGRPGIYTCGAKYICFLPDNGDYEYIAQSASFGDENWEAVADAITDILNASLTAELARCTSADEQRGSAQWE
jgi:hypothetical protein